jgi:hypothetical protein
MILSTCNLGGKSIPLRVLESLDEVLVDTDGDGQAEPIAGFGPEGAGSVGIDVRFAGPQLVFTIPKDTRISCTFSSALLAGEEGRYPIDLVATSIDPDTGGANDGAGAAPIVRTGAVAELVVGDPPPACPACGK